MYDDGLTDNQRAFLSSREHAPDFEDLSAAEINRMSFEDFARRTGRRTPAQAAIAALDAAYQASAPTAPQQPLEPVQEPQQSRQNVTEEQFLAWRAQRVSGGEGKGIFDSVGSRSDAYTNAVHAQSGRTAMSNANVQEPPRLEGRFARQDDMRDTRSAAQRFSTPGNLYGRH